MSVSFQVLLGFSEVSSKAAHDAATGAGIRIKGPIPPSGGSPGVGDAICIADNWTLVPGLMGSGVAIQAPDQLGFTFHAVGGSAAKFDTILFGYRFKVSSFAALRRIGRIRVGSGGYDFQITTAGKLQVQNLAADGVTLTSVATSLSTGTVYHMEGAIYLHPTDGALRVQLNGIADPTLTVTGADTQAGGTNDGTGVLFDESTLTVGEIYVYAGDGGFTEADFIGNATRLPRLSALFPVAQGFHSGFVTCGATGGDPEDMNPAEQDDFCAITSAGGSTNWSFVAEHPADKKMSYLQALTAGQKDSWILGGLDPLAGEIVAVQTQLLAWSEFDDERHDSHFIRHAGTDYSHPDDLAFEWIGVVPFHATMAWSSRWWPSHPAARGWEAADLIAGVELGTENLSSASKMGVTQALMYVLWLEALPEEDAFTFEGETCVPCDSTVDVFAVDSGIAYDGRNSVDGGVTPLATVLTLGINPEGDWTTVGGEHLLTADAAIFTAGDSFYVGKAIKLTGEDGATVICDIIDHNAGDATLDVEIRSAVPLSLQAVGTTTWALLIDELAIPHLEGKSVSVKADGLVLSPDADGDSLAVAAGVVALDDHYAVIQAGLPFRARLKTLPIDLIGAPSAVADLPKDVPTVTVLVEGTRKFKLGSASELHKDDETYELLDPIVVPGAADDPTALFTGRVVNVPRRAHAWDTTGQTIIQQDDPLPLTVLGVISTVNIGER